MGHCDVRGHCSTCLRQGMASTTFQSAFVPTHFISKMLLSVISAYGNGTGIFVLLKDKSWCLGNISFPCTTSSYDNSVEIFPTYVFTCAAVCAAFIV